MTIHLKKLAVGISSIEELFERQKDIASRYGEIIHITRNRPQRALNLLDGGSIYWVIKRQVKVRQRILAVKELYPDDYKDITFVFNDLKF